MLQMLRSVPLPPLRLPLRLLLLGGLGACDVGYTAVGTWQGNCTIQEQDDRSAITFQLEVEEPESGTLEGSGSFWYRDSKYSGHLRGERYAEELELTVDGARDGHGTRLTIEGELEGDTLHGECSFYGVEGDLKMSRRP